MQRVFRFVWAIPYRLLIALAFLMLVLISIITEHRNIFLKLTGVYIGTIGSLFFLSTYTYLPRDGWMCVFRWARRSVNSLWQGCRHFTLGRRCAWAAAGSAFFALFIWSADQTYSFPLQLAGMVIGASGGYGCFFRISHIVPPLDPCPVMRRAKPPIKARKQPLDV